MLSGFGLNVLGIIRARAEVLYPDRSYFIVCLVAFYWMSRDPMFFVIIGVRVGDGPDAHVLPPRPQRVRGHLGLGLLSNCAEAAVTFQVARVVKTSGLKWREQGVLYMSGIGRKAKPILPPDFMTSHTSRRLAGMSGQTCIELMA